MPKENKIIEMGLHNQVISMNQQGKSNRQIAKEIGVSEAAVRRFFKENANLMIASVKEDKRILKRQVNQTYDVIQSQLDISCRVLNKLEIIQDVDQLIKKITESAIKLQEAGIQIKPSDFAAQVALQISNNIKDFTTLTREVRENNKFLADLQSKIYDFSLLQEFVLLFIDKFKKEDPSITLKVLKEIKEDKRMRRIIESSEGDGKT